MNYLDFSMVLPKGSPEPDLSGQPDLKDYMAPELWERRQLVYTAWADQGDQEKFTDASARWLQDVRDHFARLEEEHGIEFCNWTVYSQDNRDWAPNLTVGHADQDPREHHAYRAEEIKGFLTEPRTLSNIPGWDQSSTMQRQAVMAAMLEFMATAKTSGHQTSQEN